MEITRNKADKYQGLFNYLNEQYGINPTIEGMDDLILEVDKAKQLILSGVSTMLPSIDSSTFKNYLEAKGYAETLNPLVYKKQGFQYDKEILHRHFLNEIEFGN